MRRLVGIAAAVGLVALGAPVLAADKPADEPLPDLARHVDPMVGTFAPGFTVPGASTPSSLLTSTRMNALQSSRDIAAMIADACARSRCATRVTLHAPRRRATLVLRHDSGTQAIATIGCVGRRR